VQIEKGVALEGKGTINFDKKEQVEKKWHRLSRGGETEKKSTVENLIIMGTRTMGDVMADASLRKKAKAINLEDVEANRDEVVAVS